MRLRAKTDANHAQIVKDLRAMGYSVLDLSRLGRGCPDLLVGSRMFNFLFELKDGKKCPSARKLSHDEVKFFAGWRGQAHIVETAEQAAAVIEGMFHG